jgi:hypothetical protein
MYEIILVTWYQETPDKTYDEIYHDIGFNCLEDACKFIGENYDVILDEFPVQSIRIDYNYLRKVEFE